MMLKKIILFISKSISYLYPHHTYNLIKDHIYNQWVTRRIGKVGKNVTVCRDCTLKGGQYISIGSNSYLGRFAVLTAWDKYNGQTFSPKIEIGDKVSLGEFNHITCINNIKIEEGVLSGRWVTITDNSHGVFDDLNSKINPAERPLYSKGATVIGKRVWLGDKVTILPGVNVGEGSVVAANSVVTKDVPPFSIVAGNPAKIIKQLYENI